ncbi:MAG: MBL fold metallo-hydrolase [Candidatus Hodarchaeales archaeon]
MKFINVSKSVWICQDSQYYLVNSVCVNLGSELLFVDTGINSIIAQKFRKKMHKAYNQKKAILTFTHANNDHFMGLEAFLDIPIIVTNKFMKPYTERIKSSKHPKLKGFKPTETYSSSKAFGSAENSLTFALTGGHTEDSCFGYFPAEKTLIAGDNLLSDFPQFFLHPDSNLEKIIKCLKMWVKIEIKTVIPGHGNITTPSHLKRVLAYFESLYEFLIQGRKSNLQFNEIITHPDLPEYFEPDPNNWINSGIKQVYKKICENKEKIQE